MTRRIAITGANGFIGAHLAAQLAAEGHAVLKLQRSPPADGSAWIPYALGDEPALEGVDTLVHGAHDFHSRALNVEGSTRLFHAAKRCGVRRVLFLSSLSAFDGCRSGYGRDKLAIEAVAASLGGVSARLGFVFDETGRGLSGSLRKVASRLPVIPVPGWGDQRLFLLPAAGLGPRLLRVAHEAAPGSVVPVAEGDGVTLAELLRRFAASSGRKVVLVPFPWRAMWLALRALEAAGAPLKFRSDSLVGLVNQDPNALGARPGDQPASSRQ